MSFDKASQLLRIEIPLDMLQYSPDCIRFHAQCDIPAVSKTYASILSANRKEFSYVHSESSLQQGPPCPYFSNSSIHISSACLADLPRSSDKRRRSIPRRRFVGELSSGERSSSAKSKSTTPQSLPDARWYVQQMTFILRDVRSGICFRDVSGFCSTGSQISWLPESSDVDHSHFFTAASDPLSAKYKRFAFADTTSEKSDHGSNELWSIWRSIALQRVPLTDNTLNHLSKIEDDALSHLEQKNVRNKSLSFTEMIRREIELLKKNV